MSRAWFDNGGGFELAESSNLGGQFAAELDEDHPARKAKCCNAYFRVVYVLRYVLLLFWLGAFGVSVWLGPKFLKNTKDSFQAPSGTPSAEAAVVWQRDFSAAANTHSLVVLLSSNDNSSLIEGDGSSFSQSIDTQLRAALLNRSESDLPHADAYESIESYWSVLASPVPSIAPKLLAPDHANMVFNLAFSAAEGNAAVSNILSHVRSVVKGLSTDSGRYSLGVTGDDALDADIGSAASGDFAHTDVIILPVALFVLMLYLKSARLMVLPLACVALSLLSAMTAMLPIALYALDVASFAPSIMASLTVAMSVDYSLFLLTRYREEVLSGAHRTEAEAVQATLRTSGEVILASGLTLAMTFASLIAFPMDFLQSIGVGAVATISACLIANLTFTPAMLLAFPRFFSDFTLPKVLLCVLPSVYTSDVPARRFGDSGLDDAFLPNSAIINQDAQARSAGVHAGLAQELLYDEPEDSEGVLFSGSGKGYVSPRARQEAERARRAAEAAARSRFRSRSIVDVVDDSGLNESSRAALAASPRLRAARSEQQRSFWYRSAVLSTGTWRAVLIMLLILGASVPFIMRAKDMTYTISQDELLPSSSPAVQVLDRMEKAFPPGMISPYHILLTVDSSALPASSRLTPILSAEYLSTTTDLVQTLLSHGLVANESVVSLVYAGGAGPDAWTSTPEEAAAKLAQPCPGSESACLFMLQLAQSANIPDPTQANVTQISLMTSFPPLGDEAEPWVKKLRDVLKQKQARADAALPGAFRFYLTGGATSALDAVSRIYDLFPVVVAVTVGCVLLLTGLLFRSVVVPLRLVLTLAVPLVFTYGLAVMAYQDSDFHFLGSRVNQAKGLYWLNPVMAFSILVGLGLDYDLFLSLRIAEFRQLGFTNTAAIRKGVYKTGSIITGAGLIMAIAFFGLMLSSTAVLLEFGSMLMFAVLFDTFIVRTVFLPAVLHLLGAATWWPGKRPTPTKGDLDADGEEPRDEPQQHNFAFQ